ncbi:MAG: phosphotransferase [Gammaproteobacteria bacterium]|nr:phosphotransferase [Gammaproteobacteria bacterium]
MSQLQKAVATLLNADTSSISFERITEGLSHNCFLCNCGEEKYFVKVYALAKDPAKQIAQINRTTEYMRQQGIPAPELVAYSARFANVVIHRFIDAEKADWDFNLIAPLAGLYSDIAAIGLLKQRFLGRHTYLENLRGIENQLCQLVDEQTGRSAALSGQALMLCQRVVREVSKLDSNAELLFLNLHDDFTEKNILTRNGRICLLCDWDSYRPAVFWENLASSACRFSTPAPLGGGLEHQRLRQFLQSLAPQVVQQLGDTHTFARLFAHLGILRHLRTFTFRSRVVATRRPDLEQSLLINPVKHCEWMADRSDEVASLVIDSLPE